MGVATFKEWDGTALKPLTITEAGTNAELLRNKTCCPSFEAGLTGTADNGATFTVSTGGGATVSADAAWSENGTQSLKITPSTTNTASSTSAYPWNLGAAMTNMGIVPGKTYTIAATLRQDHVQTGSLDSSARRIAVGLNTGSGDNFTWMQSAQAPNGPGVTRLSITFTVPSNATNVFGRLMHGEPGVAAGGTGGAVWWDSVMLCEGTDGTYFDGDTPHTSEYKYAWTGTPHQSTSVRKDARGGVMTAFIV